MARVLLAGPFKPFAIEDIYSRTESIPELFHNQLTRFQGIYSPRKHYPTYGLHLIGANLPADVTVLDWPDYPRFLRELEEGYDYVGIGSIMPNLQKVKRMVEAVRKYSPRSKVVIGGFCANVPDLDKLMDVDYVCAGEGISFMRQLLGFDPEFEFVHPDVGDVAVQTLGIPMRSYLPSIVTSLGCNRGCDFCSPSHFFGRKHITLLRTGEQIFNEMQRLERRYKATAFGLVGDDNFLANAARARQLRECMMRSGKPYSYGTFASADAIVKFGARQLAEMGFDSVWIGRESKFEPYAKNEGIDLAKLIDELAQWGIRVILSSILLLDSHTKKNIEEDIEDHIRCRPTFSQFSHLSPVPGTPLWERLSKEGRIIDSIPWEDRHAFKQPWFTHPEFTLAEAEAVQRRAYEKDFRKLGPSLARLIHTTVRGWVNFKQTDSPPLLARAREIESRLWFYKSAMYDMELLADESDLRQVIREMRKEVESMAGRLTAAEKALAAGAFVIGSTRKAYIKARNDVLQPRTALTRYPRDWQRPE